MGPPFRSVRYNAANAVGRETRVAWSGVSAEKRKGLAGKGPKEENRVDRIDSNGKILKNPCGHIPNLLV